VDSRDTRNNEAANHHPSIYLPEMFKKSNHRDSFNLFMLPEEIMNIDLDIHDVITLRKDILIKEVCRFLNIEHT